MIKRLVKLSFQPDKTADFVHIFETSKAAIRAMPGCLHLELLNDTAAPHIFFTLSHWASETDLNAYRDSELFQTTWAKTKALFNDKPQAWSTHCISTVTD